MRGKWGLPIPQNSETASGNLIIGNGGTKLDHVSGIQGEDNVLIGMGSGIELTIGTQNTVVGNNALSYAQGSYYNTAIGYEALNATTSPTGSNTAVGAFCLLSNTSGFYNTGVGVDCLRANTEGLYNTAIGVDALYSNIDGDSNTAVGIDALFLNTAGNYNTAVGDHALYNHTRSDTTAIGHNALLGNTTGDRNTAVGKYALSENATTSDSTAVGYYALSKNNTGSCTAVGSRAGQNATGTNNNVFGREALYTLTTQQNNTAIGDRALYNSNAGSTVAVGGYAMWSLTSGHYCTALGFQAGYTNSTGQSCVFLGHQAGYYETASNKLFIDNIKRTNEADGRSKALIYGLFDAAIANQFIQVNGKFACNGVTPSAQSSNQAALSLTGTYATDYSGLQTAVNNILTCIKNAGMMASV